jgi:hypothetical protein
MISVKKKIDPKEIIIDSRSQSVDLNEHSQFLQEYANRKLNSDAFLRSYETVENIVQSIKSKLSEEDRMALKILVDDYWIRYKDLRNNDFPCVGEEEAINYINKHNRLHPNCQKCRKILVFDIDTEFLTAITREFLKGPLSFDFKVARDLEVLVSYSQGDKSKKRIIEYFQQFIKKFGLRGRIQWRIGGKYLQRAAPHLFKSVKILSYDVSLDE